jgi:hypothetical protein
VVLKVLLEVHKTMSQLAALGLLLSLRAEMLLSCCAESSVGCSLCAAFELVLHVRQVPYLTVPHCAPSVRPGAAAHAGHQAGDFSIEHGKQDSACWIAIRQVC